MTRREPGVLPPQRRRALLEAAAAEFAEAGYERASLNRVIRSQGMSKSSFYHYFDSKEALLDAVVADLGAGFADALDLPSPAELADGFWPRINALAERVGGLAAPLSSRFAKLFYLPDAPAAPALAKARAAIDDWIEQALLAGRDAGEVGTDLPVDLQAHLVKAVLWAMDEWSIAHADDLGPAELGALMAGQLEAIRRLLAPGGTT